MDKERNSNNSYVIGLDIGTRSVVGVVGYLEYGRYKIAAMAQQLHTTRAMLDGQIHDIYKVGDTIRQVKLALERQLNMELKDVCIAAAGRVAMENRVVTATPSATKEAFFPSFAAIAVLMTAHGKQEAKTKISLLSFIRGSQLTARKVRIGIRTTLARQAIISL